MMSIPIFFLQHLSRLSSILCLFRGFLGLDLGFYTPATILWLHELNFKMLSHLLLSPRQWQTASTHKAPERLQHWGTGATGKCSFCPSVRAKPHVHRCWLGTMSLYTTSQTTRETVGARKPCPSPCPDLFSAVSGTVFANTGPALGAKCNRSFFESFSLEYWHGDFLLCMKDWPYLRLVPN